MENSRSYVRSIGAYTSKHFLNEIKSDISADLANVASEEADSITIHSFTCGESLNEQYKTYQD